MDGLPKYTHKPEAQEAHWYGSKTSCASELSRNGDSNMTFQSKDPIIPMQEKAPKEKSPGGGVEGGGGGGSHGFVVEHPTSYMETLMHLFKGNVGSGMFAMGDAIKNAGLFVGPPIVILLGIICVHCQHLLLSAAKQIKETTGQDTPPDFAETVGLCFSIGPTSLRRYANFMKNMVNVFLCVTQLGFCCVYFVFVSENIKQVLDHYGYELDIHLHMAVIFLPIWLSALVRNLKYLAPLSTLANVFMIVGIVITLYFSTKDLPTSTEKHYVATWNQFPLFFGTAIFAFEGIGLVLPLQNEMRKPQQFPRPFGVLNVGMVFVTILYMVVGLIGYLCYGEDVRGSITLNLPEDDKLAQTVKIIISMGILLTYALQFYIPVEIMFPLVQKNFGPFRFPVLAELTFRSVLVILTFTLAEAIPYLNLFISLIGAISSAALALLFPPLLELVTRSSLSEISPWLVVKNLFILALGLIGCVTGTYESIRAIVNAFQNPEGT